MTVILEKTTKKVNNISKEWLADKGNIYSKKCWFLEIFLFLTAVLPIKEFKHIVHWCSILKALSNAKFVLSGHKLAVSPGAYGEASLKFLRVHNQNKWTCYIYHSNRCYLFFDVISLQWVQNNKWTMTDLKPIWLITCKKIFSILLGSTFKFSSRSEQTDYLKTSQSNICSPNLLSVLKWTSLWKSKFLWHTGKWRLSSYARFLPISLTIT